MLKALNAKLVEWPDGVATLSEAEEFWPLRESVENFNSLDTDLKVMLLFAFDEHVQPNNDRPSIHQAYDGLVRNGNWVRLNPDSVYLEYSPDLDANSAGDWSDAKPWGYTNVAGASDEAPKAAVLEGTSNKKLNKL